MFLAGSAMSAALAARAASDASLAAAHAALLMAVNQQTNASENSKDFADAAKERRTRALDNIKKLLDIIRSMNPQL